MIASPMRIIQYTVRYIKKNESTRAQQSIKAMARFVV